LLSILSSRASAETVETPARYSSRISPHCRLTWVHIRSISDLM
jgi:hypothetical protein